MRIVLFLLLAVLTTGCATRPAATTSATLVMISVDGLRPQDVTPAQMPRLSALGTEGVRAEMRPSYPSLTFPNHYTLVTGLRPDHHGIVHNVMHDAKLGTFKVSDSKQVGNAGWWGGEPVWVTVEKHGWAADTAFWPGTEAAIHGVRPRRWLRYADDYTPTRVAQTQLQWFSDATLPRARFATLYFSQVDKASHDHGPDSNEARNARLAVDTAIGELLDGLKKLPGHPAFNVIVVSDHGFATVPAGQRISTSELASPELATPQTEGQVIGFEPKAGVEPQALARLATPDPRYRCFEKSKMPTEWHYGTNARIPSVVCQMTQGWDALFPATLAKAKARDDFLTTRGSHGYDPTLPAMRALFIAHGPAFVRGRTLPVFDNVNVYPMVMQVLGLPAQPNDGNVNTLQAALAAKH